MLFLIVFVKRVEMKIYLDRGAILRLGTYKFIYLFICTIVFFMKPLEKMPSTIAIKDLEGYTKINGNYKEEVNEWLLKSKLVGSKNLKNSIDSVLDLQKYMSLIMSRYDD